jgi:DNA-binding transcriptional regulator YiaG
MNNGKIDKVKLSQMLRQGKSVTDCAKHFGVCKGRISQIRKELNIAVVRSIALEDAHRVVSKNLDAVAQLQKINNTANELLQTAIDAEDHDTALRAMSEIRNQLKLQLDIFSMLYDVRAVQAFQTEVLEAIAEVSPDVRDRIINGLKAKSALRATLSIT